MSTKPVQIFKIARIFKTEFDFTFTQKDAFCDQTVPMKVSRARKGQYRYPEDVQYSPEKRDGP